MVKLEIDGVELTAEPGSMIIEVADEAGIHIPRFCYHKKLSVAANCRMCLVEVEKAPKTLPACATPVSDGMRVFTKSPAARESQKNIMEFLLINHPLDCPICDQGGECALQDVAMGYGKDTSQFAEPKHSVEDEDLGALVATDMTRCIHCTRCVRFGEEIAGLRELGMTGRGGHSEIGTYVDECLESEVSGNIIDLCPVGALTAKPFRFSARTWELTQHAGVAGHDCMGANVFWHSHRGQVARTVPREAEHINEVWLSDRDRFSYEGLTSNDRLRGPMVKRKGQWQPVDWATAFDAALAHIRPVLENQGPDQLGFITGPQATVEEQYLFQQLARGIDCNNVDHRVREVDTQDQDNMPLAPVWAGQLPELNQQQAIFLLGANLQRALPGLALRVRQAAQNGAQIMQLSTTLHRLNCAVSHELAVAPDHFVQRLAALVNSALSQQGSDWAELRELIGGVEADETTTAIAQQLLQAERGVIMLGAIAAHHPQASMIRYLAWALSEITQCRIVWLTDGPNSAGAWLAGAVPHRGAAGEQVAAAGLSAHEMFQYRLAGYVLMGIEPLYDCADGVQAMESLRAARHVVALTAYASEELLEVADVLLPITPFTETAGTFVNMTGEWQSFTGAAQPLGEARPAWKVLRVLGNVLHVPGFSYNDAWQVRDELQAKVKAAQTRTWQPARPESLPGLNTYALQRVGDWALYGVDPVVRRSLPLQAASSSDWAIARMHPDQAKALGIERAVQVRIYEKYDSLTLPFIKDERIPLGCIHVPAGQCQTAKLGPCYGEISVRQV